MNIIIEILWLICRITYYSIESFILLFVPLTVKNVEGEVALVTGSGRGIGREVAVLLAQKGVRVAVCDINEDDCKETVRIITESGGTAQAYRCDVTNVKDVADMAAKVRRDLGDVDLLVNNAGVLVVKTILELSEDEIRRTMNVNAVAQFWTVKEFLPSMIAKKHGHIVIIVSMAGKATSRMMTDYCSSKFAAHGFAEALADDLTFMQVEGVDITTVYPLFVNTNMLSDIASRITAHDRFLPNLTPKQVADATVEGLVRRQRYVYIPGIMAGTDLLSVLPAKIIRALKQFLQTGFYKVSRN